MSSWKRTTHAERVGVGEDSSAASISDLGARGCGRAGRRWRQWPRASARQRSRCTRDVEDTPMSSASRAHRGRRSVLGVDRDPVRRRRSRRCSPLDAAVSSCRPDAQKSSSTPSPVEGLAELDPASGCAGVGQVVSGLEARRYRQSRARGRYAIHVRTDAVLDEGPRADRRPALLVRELTPPVSDSTDTTNARA